MLLKKNRVTKKEIEEIFKKGSSLFSPSLNFKFLINFKEKEEKDFKISFIVPKTISKKAIIRNKMRRIGYKTIKKNLFLLPFNLTGAFIFKKNDTKNLENEIKSIFSKIN